MQVNLQHDGVPIQLKANSKNPGENCYYAQFELCLSFESHLVLGFILRGLVNGVMQECARKEFTYPLNITQ